VLLALMDDVYGTLVTVDYPDAITGGLRRTTDALRAVLERTRGDMTAAIRQEQLTAALTALEAKIGGAESDREG
jgi:translin